jgi:hypothetical protein
MHCASSVLELILRPDSQRLCTLQILSLDARSQHALLRYVSVYTSDRICDHAWLDNRNVVLLHESGLQELLSVAGAPICTFIT